jgi:phosphate starvation-inducible protein PhoH and related proteins
LEATVHVPPGARRIAVLGVSERNLKMIRETLGVDAWARDGTVQVRGDRRCVGIARHVLEALTQTAERDENPSREDVLSLIATESERLRVSDGPGEIDLSRLNVYAAGRPVQPKTINQRAYLQAIQSHDLVFGIGPAGTGKTYLAVAAAVHLLRTDRVRRLVLARPAVEAGEKLGFLPGDVEAKVNPYLRPLLDALQDMMDYGTIRRFMQTDVIEIVPLAFMRGRTLNNAVIILDEAQNSTRGQMHMFLTRMGQGSKVIVTGDTTQIDLPDPRESGLIDAARRLSRVPGVGFVQLTREDVVRHPLVQRIVDAYARIGTRRRPASRGAAAEPDEPGVEGGNLDP